MAYALDGWGGDRLSLPNQSWRDFPIQVCQHLRIKRVLNTCWILSSGNIFCHVRNLYLSFFGIFCSFLDILIRFLADPLIYICPFFGIFFSFLDILIRFLADPPGTHWYHSHLGTERTDGLNGALIVLPKPDKTTVTPLLSYSDKKQTFQLDTFITVNAYELSIIQIFKNLFA